MNRSSFKLLQFADLHLGESLAKDAQTLRLMRFMMTKYQPEFVVFTGDQVSGYAVASEHKRLELWSQAVTVGTPFATLVGNHDDQPYGLDTLLWHDYANYAIAMGTRAVFVGHDHDNAWCCPYRGMQLCYGQHSGYGGYHNPMESARGARIIHVTMHNESRIAVETWVQLNPNFPNAA